MTNLRRLLVALPLTALPALLAGCPIYGDGGGRRADCSVDDDCPGDLVCLAGECVDPGDPCTDDDECDAGFICVGGACSPGSRDCRTHGDCAVGAYCDPTARECTDSNTCASDGDCASGFWCDYRDTCVPRGAGECRTHGDCSAAELCIEGRCRPTPDTCQFDRECPPGAACLNNECTNICASDSDCLPGDSCQGSFCRPDPTQCTTSASCGTGEHCVDGRCLPDCASGTSCEAGSSCAADQFCRPDWGPEAFCPATPCQPGRLCLDGVCRTPCPTAPGQSCSNLDVQFVGCELDPPSGEMLCVTASEQASDCRVQADCGAGRDCHDGVCRNM